jgi:large subunit ribosomal protein L21
MVYAIIRTGGKQHKVSEGDELFVEKLKGEEGDKVEIGRVLMVNHDGKLVTDPKALSKVKIKGTILSQTRDDKIIVFKYKAKKGFHKEQGHRQSLTKIRVEKIVLPKKAEAPEKETPAERESSGAEAGTKAEG